MHAKTIFLLRGCMCAVIRTYQMAKDETPEDVRRWFLTAIQKMWPVAEGSLSLRRSPCIRKNCSAGALEKGTRATSCMGGDYGARIPRV
jgi:hypothetical protein